MPSRDESIGPAQASVWEGELLYASPSSITTYDPSGYGGCPTKWYFEKVQLVPKVETEAQRLGKEEHGQIEDYLGGGPKVFSRTVMAAHRWIPEPGEGLLIEQGVASSNMVFAGVRIVGYQDVVNLRGEYHDSMGELRKELYPNTVESLDWKTTGNIAYAKSGPQLAETAQMVTYAESLFRDFGAEHARLSHVYMQTKGAAKAQKSTILVNREINAPRVEKLESVVRAMRDTARETDITKVEKVRTSCSAFNKTCDYAAICPRSAADKLFSILGPNYPEAKKGPTDVSLKNLLRMKTGQTEAPPTSAPAPAASSPPANESSGPPKDPEERRKWLQAELQKEEAAAKAAAVRSFDPREVEILPNGRQVVLYGAAAAAYSGNPGTKCIETALAQLDKLGFSVASTSETATIKATDPYRKVPPADVPQSDPVRAAEPVPAETIATLPPAVQEVAKEHAAAAAALAPQAMEQDDEEEEGEVPDPPPAPVEAKVEAPPAPPAEAPKKRGRPPKAETPPAPAAPQWTGEVLKQGATTPLITLTVFVDAQLLEAPGVIGGDLDPFVQALCEKLAASHGTFDIRAATEGPLAFGRWKGYLDALVKANPPPPGVYTYQTYGDELRGVVANALREVVRAAGGVYVRGRA